MVIHRSWKVPSESSSGSVSSNEANSSPSITQCSSDDSNCSTQTNNSMTTHLASPPASIVDHPMPTPKRQSYVSTEKMAEITLQKLRQRYKSSESPTRSLDLLRMNLQSCFDEEVDVIVKKFLETYFRPAIRNIKENLGDDAITEEALLRMSYDLLDYSREQYSTLKAIQIKKEPDWPDVPDLPLIPDLTTNFPIQPKLEFPTPIQKPKAPIVPAKTTIKQEKPDPSEVTKNISSTLNSSNIVNTTNHTSSFNTTSPINSKNTSSYPRSANIARTGTTIRATKSTSSAHITNAGSSTNVKNLVNALHSKSFLDTLGVIKTEDTTDILSTPDMNTETKNVQFEPITIKTEPELIIHHSDDLYTEHQSFDGQILESKNPENRSPKNQSPKNQSPEIRNPEIRNPEIRNLETRNLETRNPETRNLETRNPEKRFLEKRKPELRKLEVRKPEIRKPEIRKPDNRKAEKRNPEHQNPDIQNLIHQNQIQTQKLLTQSLALKHKIAQKLATLSPMAQNQATLSCIPPKLILETPKIAVKRTSTITYNTLEPIKRTCTQASTQTICIPNIPKTTTAAVQTQATPTPASRVIFTSNIGPIRRQIYWNTAAISTLTKFVLDVEANRVFGYSAEGKDRLASKHPELIRYLPDSDDRQWLVSRKIIPDVNRNSRFLFLLYDELAKLKLSHELYKRNANIDLKKLTIFCIPEAMVHKMKQFFVDLNVKSKGLITNSFSVGNSHLRSALLQGPSTQSQSPLTIPSSATPGCSLVVASLSDPNKTKSIGSSLSLSHATLTALLNNSTPSRTSTSTSTSTEKRIRKNSLDHPYRMQ